MAILTPYHGEVENTGGFVIESGEGRIKFDSTGPEVSIQKLDLPFWYDTGSHDYIEVTAGWAAVNKGTTRTDADGTDQADDIKFDGDTASVSNTSTAVYQGGSGAARLQVEVDGVEVLNHFVNLNKIHVPFTISAYEGNSADDTVTFTVLGEHSVMLYKD